jgi:hypothetical protein
MFIRVGAPFLVWVEGVSLSIAVSMGECHVKRRGRTLNVIHNRVQYQSE